MVDTCVAPSELHLKKELSALQKARYLRDPETSSSWRTPLNSKSVSAGYSLNYGNGTGGNSGQRNTDELLQIPSSENMRKRVYLYNWGNLYSKSRESGIKLEDDDRSVGDSFSNSHKVDSTNDSCLEAPSNTNSTKERNRAIPARKTVKKLRNGISKREAINHSIVSKVPIEQSDDTEYCNSEDFLQLKHEPTQRVSNRSLSSSPLFSGSQCGNLSYSSKILRNNRREGSSHSYTPASTTSYCRYKVESWDETGASLNGDELDQLDLPSNQGCGIPFYWGKKTKDKGSGGFYSPSLSDTLRRKGSSLFCGTQRLYNKKRSSVSDKQKLLSRSSQGLPLLSDSCDGGNSTLDSASDELSINLGELELEGLSRLDGRRWSSCKSQEADLDTRNCKSFSQKYTPRSFDAIIGQNIVVQSLSSALLKGRISPAYLFQGPRGTGKTSTARIFAAALNCLSKEDNKPCGLCRECIAVFSGNGLTVKEVDAINKEGIDRVRHFLKNMSVAKEDSRYKVFIIDDCHMLSTRIWSKFMNFFKEPLYHLVFIFITIDPENLPQAVMSRCEKFLFSKVKDVDIVCRLRKICYEENLDIELDALDLIASNSDGSLRNAEIILDQLSLLGKRITTSLVTELVGVVSDEKLLDLLEIAMSADTAETIKRSRELMNSSVDPMSLMSQLAGLIMDIIAGSNQLANSQCSGIVLGSKNLSEDELKRLQHALKILSDAEREPRLSSEQLTWFTAALLQLGSGHDTEFTQLSSSGKHSSKRINEKDISFTPRESSSILDSSATSGYSSPQSCPPLRSKKLSYDILHANAHSVYRSEKANGIDGIHSKKEVLCISTEKLALIWSRCIQKCHSRTLQQLFSSHGKLVSITETESALIACVLFDDINAKSIAERYLSSITNSIEAVLQQNVELRIGVHTKTNIKSDSSELSNKERDMEILNIPRKGLDSSETKLKRTLKQDDSSVQDGSYEANFVTLLNAHDKSRGIGEEVAVIRKSADAVDGHRLENAWLQASYKNSIELGNQSNPNNNQVLPQNGVSVDRVMSSKHWADEFHLVCKDLKSSNNQKKQIGGEVDHYTVSPSLLHSNGFTANYDKENPDYESGPGCSGLFCWQRRQPHRMKVKKETHGPRKASRFNCLGNVQGRRL